MASILIIEDEQVLGESCQAVLSDDGHDAYWVPSAEDALALLEHRAVDLALIDVGLPGIDGLAFLERLTDQHPDTVPIMMTASGDMRTAIAAMKKGARDFLLKPLDLDALSALAERQLGQRRLEQTLKYERQERAQRFGVHQFIGECPEIERAKSLVRRVGQLNRDTAASAPNILITGPTGTGKDLLAKTFHYEGGRRNGPFVQVNCAAIPDSLLESELFGYVKGAFTSASGSKRGLFEVADEGTLFLDELDSLDLALQAKLLTAIDTGRIRPIGSTVEVSVDIQIIAAMNRDPEPWVASGRLRADLFHRLRVLHIELPPLTTRADDMMLLAHHFLGRHCRKFGFPRKQLSRAAKAAMRAYQWPGNVRELSHRLESAVLLTDGETIEADFLPRLGDTDASGVAAREGGPIELDFSRGPISLEKVEQQLIREALSATKHNISRAAQLLGISRDTLRYRVERHGLGVKRTGT
ncbi:MAG: sigma-54-dependent transcriptional regulator [Phycisphaerae bacterium]